MRALFAVLALLMLCTPAAVAGPDPAPVEAQAARYDTDSTRGQALEEVDRLLDHGKYQDAVARLEDLVVEYPEDVEFAWRLGKAWVDIGEVRAETGTDEEEREAYRKGVEQLREARGIDPEHRDATFNLAIAIGRYSLTGSNGDKVRGSREVKELAEKTIEIDPDFDGAYHLLGRWHREVASMGFFTKALVEVVYGGFPDASFEQALEYFRQAYALRPLMAHRLEIGICLEELGRDEEAEEVFRSVVEMESDHVDAWLMRAEAQRRLSS